MRLVIASATWANPCASAARFKTLASTMAFSNWYFLVNCCWVASFSSFRPPKTASVICLVVYRPSASACAEFFASDLRSVLLVHPNSIPVRQVGNAPWHRHGARNAPCLVERSGSGLLRKRVQADWLSRGTQLVQEHGQELGPDVISLWSQDSPALALCSRRVWRGNHDVPARFRQLGGNDAGPKKEGSAVWRRSLDPTGTPDGSKWSPHWVLKKSVATAH